MSPDRDEVHISSDSPNDAEEVGDVEEIGAREAFGDVATAGNVYAGGAKEAAGAQKTVDVHEDHEVVEAAMKKDPDALGALYDVIYPVLIRLVWFSTRDHSVADEIAASILPKILASVPYADETAPSLRAWMMSVAWNLLERDYKHALPSIGHHLPPHFLDEATAHTVEYTRSADPLAAAIRQLPASWQNYVVLRFVAGLAKPEVAFVLDKAADEMDDLESEALDELGYWLRAFSE